MTGKGRGKGIWRKDDRVWMGIIIYAGLRKKRLTCEKGTQDMSSQPNHLSMPGESFRNMPQSTLLRSNILPILVLILFDVNINQSS